MNYYPPPHRFTYTVSDYTFTAAVFFSAIEFTDEIVQSEQLVESILIQLRSQPVFTTSQIVFLTFFVLGQAPSSKYFTAS
jgi:hypothetical protein